MKKRIIFIVHKIAFSLYCEIVNYSKCQEGLICLTSNRQMDPMQLFKHEKQLQSTEGTAAIISVTIQADACKNTLLPASSDFVDLINSERNSCWRTKRPHRMHAMRRCIDVVWCLCMSVFYRRQDGVAWEQDIPLSLSLCLPVSLCL